MLKYNKAFFLVFTILFIQLPATSQINQDTTSQVLDPVTVVADAEIIQLKNTTGSFSRINSQALNNYQRFTFTNSLNSVPGVRVEERSPGSYRLSIRGSLIRSPFGVRNIKVYYGPVPLTDASGNTYFNSIDPEAITGIGIIKGPDGTLFGANTGGVVQLEIRNPDSRFTPEPQKSIINAGISTGSFGLFKEKVRLSHSDHKWYGDFYQSYQESAGYRENAAFRRWYNHLNMGFRFFSKQEITVSSFLSSTNYRTPGGLTRAQWMQDPRSARKPSGSFPGAVEQKAGVENLQGLFGITHQYRFTPFLQQYITLFYNASNFKNPFISNYEMRKERSGGIRTYIDYIKNLTNNVAFKATFGWEAQWTKSDIDNFRNKKGWKDTLTVADNVLVKQNTLLSNIKVTLLQKFLLEAGLSINHQDYLFSTEFPVATEKQRKSFPVVLLPKAGVSVDLVKGWKARATISKGYSPPTLSEFRPSTNIFYPRLNPEYGLNYESSIAWKRHLWETSLTGFYYSLQDAIVRLSDAGGNEYFTNTGGTQQKGVEWEGNVNFLPPDSSLWFSKTGISAAMTFYQFRFKTQNELNRKKVTGVPDLTSSLNVYSNIYKKYRLSLTYQYVSKLPLNDLNSDYATSYHIVQLLVSKEFLFDHLSISVSSGADNLLNEKYSLGNDLNAAGGRYYNAAPPRNYFLSLNIKL